MNVKHSFLLCLLSLTFFNAHAGIEQIYQILNLTEQEKQQIAQDGIMLRMPKERTDQELAVTLALKVNKQARTLYQGFLSGKGLDKHDDIVAAQLIKTDKDFSALQFSAAEVKELQQLYQIGPGTTFNLSKEEIRSFQHLPKDTSKDKATLKQLFRTLLLNRYQAYHEGGLAAIATYQRSDSRSYNLGHYFIKSNAQILPALAKLFPEFYQLISHHPHNNPPELQENIFLLRMNIQGRPAFALEHRLGFKEGDAYVMASRYFYVSHTLNGQQQLGMLVPDGQASLAVLITRATSDAVAGFGSSAKHLVGRKMLSNELREFYHGVQKKNQ